LSSHGSVVKKDIIDMKHSLWIRKSVLSFLLLSGVLALSYGCLTGPRNLDQYPPAERSPYKLPWETDQQRFCVQGNWGIVSHRDHGEFSYDFYMPVGSEVWAARGGTVIKVVQKYTGNGVKKANNKVVIDHGDGSYGSYLHLMKAGSLVKVRQRVRQGQAIARSGNVGRSMLPHLHFHVAGKNGESIPVSFKDVKTDRGIPRMFKFYKSGNR
jgi:murein DD-endopeptidase MepM/ murein hydrolase activator NlpD